VKVDAVILAGGDGEVIDPSCRFKGLLPVAGKPLVEWVVDAFKEATLINEIAVVIPTAEGLGPWVDRVDKLVVSDGLFMDNVLAGVASFRVDRPVLVATGDIPLITPEAVDDFVRSSLATDADFTYPLVTRAQMELEFPGSERTYFRLRTGWHTGGNAMLANPRLIPAARDLGQRLFDQRKNPIGVLRIAGLGFVVRFVLGRGRRQALRPGARGGRAARAGARALVDARARRSAGVRSSTSKIPNETSTRPRAARGCGHGV
jgi:GTP:adenosylcobinamide-phosphate guanylyltransferase